jgi:ABC-2 type transport system ATP-binding protein
MKSVEVKTLQKYYGNIKAVDGVSFTVNNGEVFGLLGPNGAGKTTIIEILEGLRRSDAGEIKVLGLDPWQNGAELHKRIGVIPQQFTFFEKTNPRDAVKYYAKIFDADVNVDQLLREVLLEESVNNSFENLSGGQKQKLGLALSMVNSPELLFLDEPTTGLDPSARRAIWDVIRRLKAASKTVILTTHYLEEAQQLSDSVAIVNHGHIIAMGTADQIIQQYGSGERLEIQGTEELSNYIKVNTKLDVEYNDKGLITIQLRDKNDAFVALSAVEESKLNWGDLQTRCDSLEDVFVKLCSEQPISLEEKSVSQF